MTTTPQAVTERYVSNLIHYGRNKEFDIVRLNQVNNIVEDEHVGVYYKTVVRSAAESYAANGATISQAVRRALIKHGVTFR